MTANRIMRADDATRWPLGALGVLLVAWVLPCSSVEGGVNVWTRHGPEGGIVSVLVVSPGNPTSLLAGTTSGLVGERPPTGGIWTSADAAASWRQSAALGDFTYVNTLAFNPSNPAIAYAATTSGIMRSQDRGDHWVSVGAISAQAIAVAPSRPTTIYAGGTYGTILKSEDGALTWRSITSGLPTDTAVVTIAVQPDSELTVYAGTDARGLFKSTDGGLTWAAVGVGLPSSDLLLISHLTFDFHDPPGLLAFAVDRRTWQSGLYRSADGGANWVTLSSYSESTSPSALTLSPRNPALIFLAGGQVVLKSTDDGASWATIAVELPINVRIGALAADPENVDVVYAGIGGGSGVLKSTDGGTNWRPFGRGLTSTDVQALALDAGPANTLYALTASYGHETELFSSRDRGGTWISLGEIRECYFPKVILVDPSNPNTLYIGSGGNGAFKSYDAGHSWVSIKQGFSSGMFQVHSLAIDPSNSRTLYAGSERFFDLDMWWGNLLYKTTNGGLTWEVTISGLGYSSSAVITALAVDPRNPATLFAGGPGLWRSTDGGRNWAATSSMSAVSAIVFDPNNSGSVLCTTGEPIMATGGTVFKTIDGGSTWTSSYPPGGAASLVLDPLNPANVYVGGRSGASMSLDGGSTWTLINGGLTNIQVTALTIDATGTMLHAATNGGGVFDLEISTATPAVSLSPDSLNMQDGTSTAVTATIHPPQLTEIELAANSSDSAVASVPDIVTLAAGDTSVSFTVSAGTVAGTAAITVRLPDTMGGSSATANVTVATRPVHVPRKHLHGAMP